MSDTEVAALDLSVGMYCSRSLDITGQAGDVSRVCSIVFVSINTLVFFCSAPCHTNSSDQLVSRLLQLAPSEAWLEVVQFKIAFA